MDVKSSNKKLAKNTFVLYLRTIFTLCISLFTSRVFLDVLGVSDYGIYNVVGGFVAMFAIISGALSASISRFITFELGKTQNSQINKVFCTSINIQLVMIFLIFAIGELFGNWFIESYLNIPLLRITAAKWVYQCSLFAFAFNLLSTPYNAYIIAHEKMKVFAYISIVEAVMKLAICYMLLISKFDKLITYAVLFLCVSILTRFIYSIYCKRNFSECSYKFIYDKALFKEMLKFSSWSFLSNATGVINNQGVNILINVFFGVTLNAARGIALQIQNAVMQFVTNFSVALNPQIIKSIASKEYKHSQELVYTGAKISFYLVFLFSTPLILEAEEILHLWLKIVPDYSVVFLRLSFIGIMIDIIGNSSTIACCATGNIKKYTILVSSIGLMVVPISWFLYKIGCPVETTYYVYIIVYIGINIARIYCTRELLNFNIREFVKNVLSKISLVVFVSLIVPLLIYFTMPESIVRLIVLGGSSIISVSLSIFLCGLSVKERNSLVIFLKSKFKHG